MEISIKSVTPGKDELTPSLWVDLKCVNDIPNACHLNIHGSMYSSDNSFLCNGTAIAKDEGQASSSYIYKISECDVLVDTSSDKSHFESTLRFPVDSKVFDHIEKLRFGNENHDVYLNFLIKVTMIEHNFSFENKTVTLRNQNQSLGKMELSKIYEFRQPIRNHRIPSADWINIFMNPLGFGKIIVFEINEPSINEISSFTSSGIAVETFKERLQAAISSLHKMQNFIKKGEWNQVAEQLRDVQLLKSDMKQGLKTLLSKTMNLPNDKCEDFTQAIDKLYSVSSQFHHSVNEGKVNPVMNVNKEDAYFVYMIMLSITQLISRKLEILGRNNRYYYT